MQEYTRWEKFQNWFYYNKWWLLAVAIVLYVAGTMVWNMLGIGQVKPDVCIAYVGSRRLPEECINALETALADFCTDTNGDGKIKVQVSQHITAEGENAMYGYAASVTVLADITQGESYFFLMEDPDAFQEEFQILANLDGSIPNEADLSGTDKVIAWKESSVLTGLDLGTYADAYLDQTENGDCQTLLEKLYLGRRFFYRAPEALPAWEQMWEQLTQQ